MQPVGRRESAPGTGPARARRRRDERAPRSRKANMLHHRLLTLLLASACLLSAPAAAHGPAYQRCGTTVRGPVATRAVWVPGHRERVETRRWVPGGTTREWIPAQTR